MSESAPGPAVPLLARRYDELTIGDRQTTRARTITEADIVMWCSLTGDWFWIHSDRERAEASSFGQRIAPGIMVWSFGAGLGVPPDAATIIANYGADRLRFTKPVFIGDTVHLDIEVLAKADKRPHEGVVDLRWDLVNQRGETVCASVLRVLQGAG